MEDHSLALLKAEQEAGLPQAAKLMSGITAREVPLDKIKGRLPWVQEPDCTSCHNFSEKPNLLTASAFNKWTPRSEGLSGLFSRRRDDMLMVRCIVCHGAPHAVYPARNPLADNLDNSRLSSTSNRRPRSGVTATVRCAMASPWTFRRTIPWCSGAKGKYMCLPERGRPCPRPGSPIRRIRR